MNGLFSELDVESNFSAFVRTRFEGTPRLLDGLMNCVNEISEERVQYAFREYQQNIGKFAVLLHSKNPDHYKRSGALMHALYQSNAVVGVTFTNGPYGTVDELESGFTRVSHGDAQHTLTYVDFYKEYHNQLLAFELAYRCCAAYEPDPRSYDFDYVRNICHYLRKNNNLNVDSCFMIFKSLMM